MASKLRKPYGPFIRVKLDFPEGEGRTKQNHKDECDVNLIIKRHDKTGLITHVRQMEAQFGDMTGDDFQTAMNKIAAAKSAFEELPSQLRSRFQNDPAEFLDYMNDESNLDEHIRLGLVNPPKPGEGDAVTEPAPEDPPPPTTETPPAE